MMFRRTIDKWRLKYLNSKIDKLLHDNDSKIGRKFRHNNKFKRILLMLMPSLPLQIAILLIIVIFLITGSIDVFFISFVSLFLLFSPVFYFSISISDWVAKFQSEQAGDYYSPIPAAMNRWFAGWYVKDDRPDSDRIIIACYEYLLHEDVNELFKESELFTDADYGRLVKPILAYIKVCLTVDDGNNAEFREEFIRNTDLDQFLHDMEECKSKLQLDQKNRIKNKGIDEIDNVTKTIGMNKPFKKVNESVEMRRLNNVTNELKKTNGQLVTTIKNIEQRI